MSPENFKKLPTEKEERIKIFSKITNKSKIFGDYSKDYLEVFFDEK